MRSLGSWSPRSLRPVAKLRCYTPKRGIRIIRHAALTRQERGRKTEQNGQPPQHFSGILDFTIIKGIDQVAEPKRNGEVQSEKSLKVSSDERQLWRGKSFIKRLPFLNRSPNGSSHAEGDGNEGSLQNLSKDHDGSPAELKSEKEDSQHRKSERPSKTPALSLFEELFPEEAARQGLSENSADQRDKEFPRLPLPEMIEDDGGFEDEYVRGRKLDSETAEAASKDAYRLWNPSILVLHGASPSLDESDFRRIAPRGQHIEKWVGPGDFFKVIPGRDALSLKQKPHYWLIFPNPAYARAYQNQVIHLHNLARTHTPTSIESPMQPPKGMFLKGEEVYKLLQDYALCPPSRNISLLSLFPPLSFGMQRILRYKGYPELTQPRDKTGKAVLFWVEGFIPNTEQILQFIKQDGRDRGMAWALMDGQNSIQQIDPEGSGVVDEEEGEEEGAEQQEPTESEAPDFRDHVRRISVRWIIAFENENEARRFVRRWHLRPFTSALDGRDHRGDHAPLIHAEYVW